MVRLGEPKSRFWCGIKLPRQTILRLGEGGLCLGEPKGPCSIFVGDCLKLMYGLFGTCYIACFRGLLWVVLWAYHVPHFSLRINNLRMLLLAFVITCVVVWM